MPITFGQRIHWLTSLANTKPVALAHGLLTVLASVSRGLVMDWDWLHKWRITSHKHAILCCQLNRAACLWIVVLLHVVSGRHKHWTSRINMLIFQPMLGAKGCVQCATYLGWPVTACSACSSAGGNTLPLFSARRRMPLQAVALKKNRCGSSPVSKVSDNEHTLASLGHSEVLSVKNAVCEPIPEFSQRPEEDSKIFS
jgi:hypothetical protein